MTQSVMIVSDHAGFALKEQMKHALNTRGCHVHDLGPHNEDSVDYPLMGEKLATQLGSHDTGIAICGSGIGISIALNRHAHIRAALCHNTETASLARQHNDANVLCLGARLLDETHALAIADTFLTTEFEGGRHQRRVDQLSTPTLKESA